MKHARITIRAAQNRDTREGEQSITRELDCGILLMGLKAMTQELIDKMGGDYFYVTGVDIERRDPPKAVRLDSGPWPVYDGEDDYDPRG